MGELVSVATRLNDNLKLWMHKAHNDLNKIWIHFLKSRFYGLAVLRDWGLGTIAMHTIIGLGVYGTGIYCIYFKR